MALRHESVAAIDSPEFINLTPNDINPGISNCEIKVMYVGKNRNGSYISKETAKKMAGSLRGTPIVAAWHEEEEDFGDHGDVIHIENGKITFSCSTVPYGFVAPNAEVWFQKFTETDDFGEQLEREYMMTTGYLWTGQYPEITKCITEGQGQSMEIDISEGHWATDSKTDVDFFIINDADIMKLCVLGDEVEPCYEGASVTDIDVSKEFSLAGEDFNHTMFSMMKELKATLENEGGLNMPDEQFSEEEVKEAPATETEPAEEPAAEGGEEFAAESEEQPAEENPAEFASDKKDEEGTDDEDPEDADDDAADDKDDKDEENNALTASMTELVEKFEALKNKCESLEAEVESLRSFKCEREMADKDALIAKYHMLSEEDKAEVEAHKAEFSLDEIESKLALIYVQKNVNFDTVDGSPAIESEVHTSFTLVDNEVADEADFMLQALREANNL